MAPGETKTDLRKQRTGLILRAIPLMAEGVLANFKQATGRVLMLIDPLGEPPEEVPAIRLENGSESE